MWPDSERSLALSALTVALYESSLREDIQSGRKRGAAGEACLVQVMPEQAPKFASWLPREERQRLAADPKAREAFLETLLGDSPQALSRCFELGMRMLAQARASCAGSAAGWEAGMFSLYGTGRTCSWSPMATIRQKTLRRFLNTTPRLSAQDAALLGLPPEPPILPAPPTPNTPVATVDRTFAPMD